MSWMIRFRFGFFNSLSGLDWTGSFVLGHNGKVLVLAIDVTVVFVFKNVCWMANRLLKLSYLVVVLFIFLHFDAMLEYLA